MIYFYNYLQIGNCSRKGIKDPLTLFIFLENSHCFGLVFQVLSFKINGQKKLSLTPKRLMLPALRPEHTKTACNLGMR